MEKRCGCTLDPTKYHCACFNRETLICSNGNYCGFKKKEKESKWFEKYYKNTDERKLPIWEAFSYQKCQLFAIIT